MAHQQLLLVRDVEKLGRSGDVVRVRNGYARNFLIPEGLAVVADKGTLRRQARLKEERLKQAEQDRQESQAMADRLQSVTLTTIVKVDPEGNMYGSVSDHDLVRLLEEQAGIHIERRAFQLKHPIKETGVHSIAIKLKEGVVGEIRIKVIPENAPEMLLGEDQGDNA